MRSHELNSFQHPFAGFVLQHPLLMSVVIGATKVSQLKEILQAREVIITDEIRSEIDAVHQLYPNPAP